MYARLESRSEIHRWRLVVDNDETHSLPRVWLRWVLANIAGELVGFGLAAAAGALVALGLRQVEGGLAIALGVLGVIVLGTLEGGVLGVAQWLALRRWLPTLWPTAWITATILGAILAWAAGMAAGTLMGSGAAFTEGTESPAGIVAGAALVGIGAGALLSSTQWLVLRTVLARAGWWIPAHAAGWAAGMVVSFLGIGLVQQDTPLAAIALIGAATGLAMGVTVAAVTGLALVWLFSSAQDYPRG
jgi:hypothetical protein